MNIPVVYEDDYLVVLNKPSGLLVIPTPKNETRTLTSILNDDLKGRGVAYRLHACHRLDRETSGLIVYAKGKSMQAKMMALFQARQIKKSYIAFVHGIIEKSRGVIRTPLERAQAITEYQVLERKKDFSVVEVRPATGRTNQLRLHFKAIGHPIVGETKFVFRKDYALRASRLCLHAAGLEFSHPVTRVKITLEAELAEDLAKFLKRT